MAEIGWQRFLAKVRSPIMKRGVYTLDHVKSFHDALGKPGDSLNVIHVAGTNAKGTITYKLARMLELSGYKTGMFQSPHLFSWRERVQVNSELVSKEYCVKFLEMYEETRKKLGGDELSFFEFFTVLAFQYYKDMNVDVAVVEVGLGGRLDATNILEKSLLSVITSISLDHTQTLGNTAEKIAGRGKLTQRRNAEL